ncbi:hypothetical protein ASE63_18450 [Bosea sp. Root381]|uniref:hypothetical protein n=1 Tax=Bosea sp. Root381 TaxID=1736524 RepID=UPI0006FAFA75|nr:hypothetical protein [Bosea sp. Root381]KRE13454.1 hypothetical protein ASE63_18450 [Bosea sp. Root381]
MPSYKITTDVDGDVQEEINDFPSQKAATDDIQIGLADALREKMPDGSHVAFAGTVADMNGRLLYRMSIEFRAQNAEEIAEESRLADEAAAQILTGLGKWVDPA